METEKVQATSNTPPKAGKDGPNAVQVITELNKDEMLQKIFDSVKNMENNPIGKVLHDAAANGDKDVSKAVRDASAAGSNFLERGIHWTEEKSGRWLPAAGKAAGYLFLGNMARVLVVRGTKAGIKLVTGNPVEAAVEVGGAFQDITS